MKVKRYEIGDYFVEIHEDGIGEVRNLADSWSMDLEKGLNLLEDITMGLETDLVNKFCSSD